MQTAAGGRERGDGDLVTDVMATAWCSTVAVSLAVALSHDTNRVTTVMDDHAFTLREVSSSRTFLSDARDIHVSREMEHPGAALSTLRGSTRETTPPCKRWCRYRHRHRHAARTALLVCAIA